MNKKDLKRFMDWATTVYGCCVCRMAGFPGTPAEWHHPIGGRHGMGIRAKDEAGIPVCPHHHRQGGRDSIHGHGNEEAYLQMKTGKGLEELRADVWRAYEREHVL